MPLKDEEITFRKGIQEKLDSILAQTTKTNGRVTRLERAAVAVIAALIGMGATNPDFLNLLKGIIAG